MRKPRSSDAPSLLLRSNVALEGSRKQPAPAELSNRAEAHQPTTTKRNPRRSRPPSSVRITRRASPAPLIHVTLVEARTPLFSAPLAQIASARFARQITNAHSALSRQSLSIGLLRGGRPPCSALREPYDPGRRPLHPPRRRTTAPGHTTMPTAGVAKCRVRLDGLPHPHEAIEAL